MGFLRALLVILIIFLLLRLLGRLLFRWGVSRRAGMGDYRSGNTSGSREGDVTIKYKPEKNGKIIDKDDGEYIKYEEIDED